MADISEALERLAGLRDRGVLTAEEFDQQKAALLNPPVAPAASVTPLPIAAAPSAGSDKTPLYIIAGILLVAAVGAILWATGVFGRSDSSSVASSPFGVAPAATASASVTASSFPAASSPPAATAALTNPILGEWVTDGNNPECPTRLTVLSTQMVASMPSGRVDSQNVSYTVQDAATVLVNITTGSYSRSKPATVRDGRLTFQSCDFHHG